MVSPVTGTVHAKQSSNGFTPQNLPLLIWTIIARKSQLIIDWSDAGPEKDLAGVQLSVLKAAIGPLLTCKLLSVVSCAERRKQNEDQASEVLRKEAPASEPPDFLALKPEPHVRIFAMCAAKDDSQAFSCVCLHPRCN